MLLLTETDLNQCVGIGKDEMQVVEEGFAKLACDSVEMPPIQRLDVHEHNGEIDIKSAYVKGSDIFAVKMSTGFFDNPKKGLPSGNGMIVVFCSHTGSPKALLFDNGYLTDIRTGLAGGIASKHLARQDAKTIGMVGTGKQARFQLRALKLVRNYEKVLVHGLDRSFADQFIDEMTKELDVEMVFEKSVPNMLSQSDIVITSTPATKPIIYAEWVRPGMHITAMGSDAEHKQEINEHVFSKVDKIVCDKKTQSFRLGELHHALVSNILSESSSISEIGEIILGQKKGRISDDEITICDLTGTGAQDAAIAALAYQKASRLNLGQSIDAAVLGSI